MQSDFNPQAISLAFRFYARTLVFPYDELTHELHYLFRELEKSIETTVDNTVAARILDVINFYQGEEMQDLQAEFTRMFTPIGDEAPAISLQLADIAPEIDNTALFDLIMESPLFIQAEEYPDAVPQILDFFSSLLLDDPQEAEIFFETYLQKSLPLLNEQIFRSAGVNFYKEAAKGLNELVFLLAEE